VSLVMSRGNVFSVVTEGGDIAPAGARDLGLFREDTRHLSLYRLALAGGAPARLSANTITPSLTQIDLTATGLEVGAFVDEPVNFLHIRRRQLLDEELVDHLVFTNHLDRAVDVAFALEFGADFADVFEVRGAQRARRGVSLDADVGADRVALGYRGLDGAVYRTSLRFTPAPASIGPALARYRLALEPGEARLVEVAIAPSRDGVLARTPAPFDRRVEEAREEARAFRARGARLHADNRIVARTLRQALDDVRLLRILHGDRWIVGAGIPWFAAPFGRDALIASSQLLGFAPELAVETLRFLAAYQGRVDDPARDEEPGKIMHELRRGEMTRAGETPHAPYYGSIDATPLYAIVAGEAWRWHGDRAFLDEIWPAVTSSIGWLDRASAHGDRFVTYRRRAPRGLDNQGWKDSRDAIAFPDGRRAEPPIALVEVQGYAIDAYRRAAELARARGESVLASQWQARSERLRARLDDAFWVAESSYYALALDGTERRVPTIASNAGHLLWSRAVSPARARRITDVLLSEGMFSGWGVRTAARGQTIYNPLGYHTGTIWPHDNALAAMGMARYGLHREAMRVAVALLEATGHFPNGRLPELFCGLTRGARELIVHYPVSCSPQAWASGALFMLLHAVLGLDPDAPTGRLRIWNPMLPPMVARLDVRDLRVGDARVSLRFGRRGRRTHVDVLALDGPLRVEIEMDRSSID
jgi:glycogen debranching enzyme